MKNKILLTFILFILFLPIASAAIKTDRLNVTGNITSPKYCNDTWDCFTISQLSIGNASTYESRDGNITIDNSAFTITLALLDLAEFDNSVSLFITNAVSDLVNYFTKTEIIGQDHQNGTQVNATIAFHNASIKSYVDSQDAIFNISMVLHDETTNISQTSYTDSQDTVYNESMVLHDETTNTSMTVHVETVNANMTTYVDTQDTIYNRSMTQHVNSTNLSMKNYVDDQDVVYNDSMFTYVGTVNDTMKNYVDAQDNIYNASMVTHVKTANDTMITHVEEVNASMKVYVDNQDTIYNSSMVLHDNTTNASMKVYVDAQDIVFNDTLKNYVDAQNAIFNTSMVTHDKSTNTSQTAYTDAQDVIYNSSMVTHDKSTNDSMKIYVDSQDSAINTTENIEVLGFNITVDLINNAKINNATHSDTSSSTLCANGEYLDVGLCINFNDTVKSITASTTYNASLIATISGTLDMGDLTSIQIPEDGNSYNVSEDSGASPLIIVINFSNVISFDSVIGRIWYEGGLGHEIQLEIWRYDTEEWENYEEYTDTTDFVNIHVPIYDPTNHVSSTNNVSIRFNHFQSGVPTHNFYIDYLALVDGFTALTTSEHDGLGGRDNKENHPWVDKHIDNDSIVRSHNTSWITTNQEKNYINNCSVDQSCDTIIYTTDDTGNTTAEIRAQFTNSSNITYDESTGSFFYNGTVGVGVGAGAGDKWVDDGDWISPNTTFASTVNASKFTADLGVNITKKDISCPSGSFVNASNFYDDGVLLTPDTTISNCSVQDSCSLVAYQTDIINNCSVTDSCSNIAYGNFINNCSVDTSCDAVTYDNELAYISNCSVDQSCDTILYTTDDTGNTTTEIQAVISSGDGNLSYSNGVFKLALVDLAELDNSVSVFITAAVAALDNFFTKTETTLHIASNVTNANTSMASHVEDVNANMTIYVDEGRINNCSVTDSCSGIAYGDFINNCSVSNSCSDVIYTGQTANATDAFNITISNGIEVEGNATIRGLHIDRLNTTHWRIWG